MICPRSSYRSPREPASRERSFDGVVFQDRVGEELPAHLVHTRASLRGVRYVDVELDHLADAQVRDVRESETAECPLHRGPLDVEDAGLEPDEHPDLHGRGWPAPAPSRSLGRLRRLSGPYVVSASCSSSSTSSTRLWTSS